MAFGGLFRFWRKGPSGIEMLLFLAGRVLGLGDWIDRFIGMGRVR